MAAPILWGLGIAAGAVIGWTGFKAGSAIAEDVDTLGDVAVAGAAGWIAGQVTKNSLIGLGTAAATWWALQQQEDTG